MGKYWNCFTKTWGTCTKIFHNGDKHQDWHKTGLSNNNHQGSGQPVLVSTLTAL